MSNKRGCLYIFLAFLLFIVVVVAIQFRSSSAEFVGPDTTILTSPLRDDGTVDYARAINEDRQLDISPEENALVGLLPYATEFYGHSPDYQINFVDTIGLDAIPAAIDFEEPELYARTQLEALRGGALTADDVSHLNSLMKGLHRPWSSVEFPKAAEALKKYEAQYQQVIKASKLPKYFHPMVSDGNETQATSIVAIRLSCMNVLRSFGRAFSARALNQIAEGDISGAIESTKTIRRLVALSSQSETMIEALACNAVFGIGMVLEKQLLLSGELSKEQLADYQAFLDSHPIANDIADRLNKFERYITLDTIQLLKQGSLEQLNPGAMGGGTASSALFKIAMSSLDLGKAMKQSNMLIDTLVAALKEPNKSDRLKKIAEFESVMYEIELEAMRPWKYAFSVNGRSKMAGNIIVAMMCPAITQAQESVFRSMMEHEVVVAAVALERFKAEHGSYPDKLEELVPDFCKSVPMEPVEGVALRYRKTANSMVVYSVGVDGKDDGGLQWNEIAGGSALRGDIRYLVGEKPIPRVGSQLDKDRKSKLAEKMELPLEEETEKKREQQKDESK